jgi:hypothetical protein
VAAVKYGALINIPGSMLLLGRNGPRRFILPTGAMAVCDRRLDGFSHQEISAQLCMSMNMVMRYSKHIDQERLAREANKRRT